MQAQLKLTYHDYAALPESSRYQLVDGELKMSPAPSLRHQKVAAELFLVLTIHVKAHDLGTVWIAPVDVILADESVLQPDIAFVSNQNGGILSAEGIRGAPDLCVEVLSPRTRTLDRDTKRKLYARYGVTEYWIVDPDGNTVEAFRLQEDPSRPTATFTRTQVMTSALLPGLSIELPSVFA